LLGSLSVLFGFGSFVAEGVLSLLLPQHQYFSLSERMQYLVVESTGTEALLIQSFLS
jgi:hypothetical protein